MSVTQTEFENSVQWEISKASTAGIKVDTTTPTFPWRDIIGLLLPNPANLLSPANVAFTAGGNIRSYAYASGDQMDCVFHIPHDYVIGTDIFLHLHYGHNGTAVDAVTFDVDAHTAYATRDEDIFTELATTPAFSIDMDTAVQYQHYVNEIQLSAASPSTAQIDTDDIEVDGLVLVTLDVTDIPGITGGAAKPFIFTCDIHYQSTGIGTKNSADPFYT